MEVGYEHIGDIRYQGQQVLHTERDSEHVFGQHVIARLEGCDLESISSAQKIMTFAKELVIKIDMKAYGEPFVQRFAEHSQIAAGYSLAQMIETSLISAHFSEYWRTIYLDIFSCKAFDTEAAVNFSKKFFGAESANVQVLMR